MLAFCALFVLKMRRLVRHTLIKQTKFIRYRERIVGSVVSSHRVIIFWVTDLALPEIVKRYTIPTEKKKKKRIATMCNLMVQFFLHFLKFRNRKHGHYKTIDQINLMSQKDTSCIGKVIWNGGFCLGSSRVQGNVDAFCWGRIRRNDASE